MISKFFKYFLPYIQTLFFYKPFFKKGGKHIVIIKPIQITPSCMIVGNKVLIFHHSRIEGVSNYQGITYNPSIIIGNNVIIQQNLHLTCAGNINIGNNTAIAANVTISDITHGYENINLPPEQHAIKVMGVNIGPNCKLFNNVIILPGTTLGKHNIVGANAVVGGIYPDYCVIVGAPAKIVKRYNAETENWERTDSKGNFIK